MLNRSRIWDKSCHFSFLTFLEYLLALWIFLCFLLSTALSWLVFQLYWHFKILLQVFLLSVFFLWYFQAFIPISDKWVLKMIIFFFSPLKIQIVFLETFLFSVWIWDNMLELWLQTKSTEGSLETEYWTNKNIVINFAERILPIL